MTLLSVRHITRYAYKAPVSFGEHRLLARPRDSFDQRLISFRLEITPRPKTVRWLHDVFGNCIAVTQFACEADELTFDTNIVLDHDPTHAPDFTLESDAQTYPFAYEAEETPDLVRLIERQYPDPDRLVETWARKFLPRGGVARTGQLLMTLTSAIRESFVYE